MDGKSFLNCLQLNEKTNQQIYWAEPRKMIYLKSYCFQSIVDSNC